SSLTKTINLGSRRSWLDRRSARRSRRCSQRSHLSRSECSTKWSSGNGRSFMLADVLGAFLDSVSEAEFNAPFLGLLRGQGFAKVHFTHGPLEFGKDSIGQKVTNGTNAQYGFQLKAGDMNLAHWRAARNQIEDIRTTGLVHPDFDRSLPRRGVLVLTGRLKDQARVAAQEYAESFAGDPKFGFEVWDRDHLVELLLQSPEVGLSGAVEGPLLSVLGHIDERKVTEDE